MRLLRVAGDFFSYREDLGPTARLINWVVWAASLALAVILKLPAGYFVARQTALAAIRLIQLRVNPKN